MPRTDLTVQTIVSEGLAPTYAAANTDGNAFLNGGRTFLHVKNASAAAVTVTVVTPLTVNGRVVADDVISVPAGGERFVGAFPPALFNNTGVDANKVHVNYSAVASVTVAAFDLP